MFTIESGLVKIWVKLVEDINNIYTFNDVPNLFNLRQIVSQVLVQDGYQIT